MFRYETHKNMSLGKSGECTRLVLRDKNDEVIFIAADLGEDHYIMGKKGDNGFENLVKAFSLATVEESKIINTEE